MLSDPADGLIDQVVQRGFEADSLDDIQGASVVPLGAFIFDELDAADEEFTAFLLEALGEGQITVPEFGTITMMILAVAIISIIGFTTRSKISLRV